VSSDDLERVLQPGARPAAQVQYPVAGAQQAQLLVDFLELVDGPSYEPRAARLPEEGIVAMPGVT
jgi:hypothetical protein